MPKGSSLQSSKQKKNVAVKDKKKDKVALASKKVVKTPVKKLEKKDSIKKVSLLKRKSGEKLTNTSPLNKRKGSLTQEPKAKSLITKSLKSGSSKNEKNLSKAIAIKKTVTKKTVPVKKGVSSQQKTTSTKEVITKRGRKRKIEETDSKSSGQKTSIQKSVGKKDTTNKKMKGEDGKTEAVVIEDEVPKQKGKSEKVTQSVKDNENHEKKDTTQSKLKAKPETVSTRRTRVTQEKTINKNEDLNKQMKTADSQKDSVNEITEENKTDLKCVEAQESSDKNLRTRKTRQTQKQKEETTEMEEKVSSTELKTSEMKSEDLSEKNSELEKDTDTISSRKTRATVKKANNKKNIENTDEDENSKESIKDSTTSISASENETKRNFRKTRQNVKQNENLKEKVDEVLTAKETSENEDSTDSFSATDDSKSVCKTRQNVKQSKCLDLEIDNKDLHHPANKISEIKDENSSDCKSMSDDESKHKLDIKQNSRKIRQKLKQNENCDKETNPDLMIKELKEPIDENITDVSITGNQTIQKLETKQGIRKTRQKAKIDSEFSIHLKTEEEGDFKKIQEDSSKVLSVTEIKSTVKLESIDESAENITESVSELQVYKKKIEVSLNSKKAIQEALQNKKISKIEISTSEKSKFENVTEFKNKESNKSVFGNSENTSKIKIENEEFFSTSQISKLDEPPEIKIDNEQINKVSRGIEKSRKITDNLNLLESIEESPSDKSIVKLTSHKSNADSKLDKLTTELESSKFDYISNENDSKLEFKEIDIESVAEMKKDESDIVFEKEESDTNFEEEDSNDLEEKESNVELGKDESSGLEEKKSNVNLSNSEVDEDESQDLEEKESNVELGEDESNGLEEKGSNANLSNSEVDEDESQDLQEKESSVKMEEDESHGLQEKESNAEIEEDESNIEMVEDESNFELVEEESNLELVEEESNLELVEEESNLELVEEESNFELVEEKSNAKCEEEKLKSEVEKSKSSDNLKKEELVANLKDISDAEVDDESYIALEEDVSNSRVKVDVANVNYAEDRSDVNCEEKSNTDFKGDNLDLEMDSNAGLNVELNAEIKKDDSDADSMENDSNNILKNNKSSVQMAENISNNELNREKFLENGSSIAKQEENDFGANLEGDRFHPELKINEFNNKEINESGAKLEAIKSDAELETKKCDEESEADHSTIQLDTDESHTEQETEKCNIDMKADESHVYLEVDKVNIESENEILTETKDVSFPEPGNISSTEKAVNDNDFTISNEKNYCKSKVAMEQPFSALNVRESNVELNSEILIQKPVIDEDIIESSEKTVSSVILGENDSCGEQIEMDCLTSEEHKKFKSEDEATMKLSSHITSHHISFENEVNASVEMNDSEISSKKEDATVLCIQEVSSNSTDCGVSKKSLPCIAEKKLNIYNSNSDKHIKDDVERSLNKNVSDKSSEQSENSFSVSNPLSPNSIKSKNLLDKQLITPSTEKILSDSKILSENEERNLVCEKSESKIIISESKNDDCLLHFTQESATEDNDPTTSNIKNKKVVDLDNTRSDETLCENSPPEMLEKEQGRKSPLLENDLLVKDSSEKFCKKKENMSLATTKAAIQDEEELTDKLKPDEQTSTAKKASENIQNTEDHEKSVRLPVSCISKASDMIKKSHLSDDSDESSSSTNDYISKALPKLSKISLSESSIQISSSSVSHVQSKPETCDNLKSQEEDARTIDSSSSNSSKQLVVNKSSDKSSNQTSSTVLNMESVSNSCVKREACNIENKDYSYSDSSSDENSEFSTYSNKPSVLKVIAEVHQSPDTSERAAFNESERQNKSSVINKETDSNGKELSDIKSCKSDEGNSSLKKSTCVEEIIEKEKAYKPVSEKLNLEKILDEVSGEFINVNVLETECSSEKKESYKTVSENQKKRKLEDLNSCQKSKNFKPSKEGQSLAASEKERDYSSSLVAQKNINAKPSQSAEQKLTVSRNSVNNDCTTRSFVENSSVNSKSDADRIVQIVTDPPSKNKSSKAEKKPKSQSKTQTSCSESDVSKRNKSMHDHNNMRTMNAVSSKSCDEISVKAGCSRENTQDSGKTHLVSGKRKNSDTETHSVESKRAKTSNVPPVREYLDQFVPFLLEGLLKIAYNRPEDPIQYLADWMIFNKDEAYRRIRVLGV